MIRLLVLRPELAIVKVARPKLPPLLRVIDAFLQPLALLFLGDVQEALDHRRALVGEQLLETANVLVALRPHRPWCEVLDAHDEHVLIVTAIEDANPALRWHL